MKTKRFISMILAVMVAVLLLFVFNQSRVTSSPSVNRMANNTHTSTFCQASCPVLLAESNTKLAADEGADFYPAPVLPFYITVQNSVYLGTILSVAHILAWLRRRPPDLVPLYAKYRN